MKANGRQLGAGSQTRPPLRSESAKSPARTASKRAIPVEEPPPEEPPDWLNGLGTIVVLKPFPNGCETAESQAGALDAGEKAKGADACGPANG
jgi:hypothetical protein